MNTCGECDKAPGMTTVSAIAKHVRIIEKCFIISYTYAIIIIFCNFSIKMYSYLKGNILPKLLVINNKEHSDEIMEGFIFG